MQLHSDFISFVIFFLSARSKKISDAANKVSRKTDDVKDLSSCGTLYKSPECSGLRELVRDVRHSSSLITLSLS